jgi:hypothetical protein
MDSSALLSVLTWPNEKTNSSVNVENTQTLQLPANL